jgi:hypothetical protein
MQERIKKANKTYCDGHDEEGIEVCCWDKMPGWQMFMKGEITEAELCDQAKEDLAQMNESFGKYLRDDKKEEPEAAPEAPLGEKVKTANKIYKQACIDSGTSPCFFKNFATWQQFVHGEIGESEFYDRAREEIRKIAAEQKIDN